MKRYGISSYGELLENWNPGQILLAVDAIFWNSPKEKEKYRESDYQIASAPMLSARQLAGLE